MPFELRRTFAKSMSSGLPIGAVVAATATVVFMLVDSGDPRATASLGLAALLAAAVLLSVGLLAEAQPLDVFDPLWLVVLELALLGGIPVVMLSSGKLEFAFVHTGAPDVLAAKTLAVVVLSGGALLIGYSTRLGKALAHSVPVPPDAWSDGRRRLVCVAVVAISVGAAFIVVSALGGLENYADRGTGMESLSGLSYLIVAMLVSNIVPLLYIVSSKHPLREVGFWISLVIGVSLAFATGSRTNVILWVIVPVAMTLGARSFGRPRVRLILVALGALWISRTMLSFRGGGAAAWESPTSVVAEAEQGGSLLESALADRRVYSDVLSWLVFHVPDPVEPLLGRHYAALLSAPVPRPFWPGKPRLMGEGAVLGQLVLGPGAAYGIPPPMPGFFYWNFLLPGVFLGFVLVGVYCRTVLSYRYLYRDNRFAQVIYPVAWNGVTLFFTVNGLMKVVPIFVSYLLVLRIVTGAWRKRGATMRECRR